MSQKMANDIRDEFKKLTGIDVSAVFMEKGVNHSPTSLQTGKCGVYVFLNESACFKVGKAGLKTKARWNSHHYNLDRTTPSTLPKSIKKNIERFKEKFPLEMHQSIDAINKSIIKEWVKENLSRIEFLLTENDDKYSLNLLEALVQFRLKPMFEGKGA